MFLVRKRALEFIKHSFEESLSDFDHTGWLMSSIVNEL